MPTRERLHRLVESLPESEVRTAERMLEYLRDTADPFLRSLADAPIDDEPLTPEDEAALQQGLNDLARGEVVSDEDLRRELGL